MRARLKPQVKRNMTYGGGAARATWINRTQQIRRSNPRLKQGERSDFFNVKKKMVLLFARIGKLQFELP